MDRKKIERLHRQLNACRVPQAVIALPKERFVLVPFDSPRIETILSDTRWAPRCRGIFRPDVDYSTLHAEVAA